MVMTAPGERLGELRIDRSARDDEVPRWAKRLGLLVVALVLVGFLSWWFVLRDRAVVVQVAEVAWSEAAGRPELSVLDASGYVTARRQSTVSSKVTGKIVEVLVEEGMVVREGQVLARLDDSLPRKQLALAEAVVASANSNLREIEVRRDEAERELARQRRLQTAGVSSESDLDAAQAEFDALSARLMVARDDLAVAERQVALRLQEVDDTLIRAPFAGVAISKNAQPGEMISPISAGGGFTRTGVSTIVDMDSLEIEVDVNEAYINRVRADQRVVATLDAYPDWKIPAFVITTIPAADRQKATVRVRIGFDELGDPRILPDMGVKVSFQADRQADNAEGETARVLLIPRQAVREQGGREIVFVVRDGVVEQRAVALGGDSGERREVVSGLKAGDRVVIEPPETLSDGMEVRIQ
jgi:RND family efflux transporter MFP subunit